MILRAMGHGDEIAIVDANYPADNHANRLVRLDGHPGTRIVDAILSVMPLDPPQFVPVGAWHMEVAAGADPNQPIFEEYRALIKKHEGPQAVLGSIERFAFYEKVKQCYAIVASGERRLYGNIILKKGVIRPDE
jgi:L-fucose mutarotase